MQARFNICSYSERSGPAQATRRHLNKAAILMSFAFTAFRRGERQPRDGRMSELLLLCHWKDLLGREKQGIFPSLSGIYWCFMAELRRLQSRKEVKVCFSPLPFVAMCKGGCALSSADHPPETPAIPSNFGWDKSNTLTPTTKFQGVVFENV
jgi:hypothetical protein